MPQRETPRLTAPGLVALVLAVVGLGLTSCGTIAPGEGSDAQPDTALETTPVEDSATDRSVHNSGGEDSAVETTSPNEPIDEDDGGPTWPVEVTIDEPGARPELAWRPIDDAALYELVVLTADGRAYWSWTGADTNTALGGLPVLAPGASGPRLSDGMTWALVAMNSAGIPIEGTGGSFDE